MNLKGRWLAALCLAVAVGAAVADSAPTPGDRDRDRVIHGRDRNVADRLGATRTDQPAVAAVATEAAASCDVACLQGLVDTYLHAVVAHDPRLLPAAEHLRVTEMGQDLPPGEGFWSTASGVGGFQLYALDPVTQQAGLIGTMREFDNVVLMALRLKVQNRRISEVETLFYRKGQGPAWSDAGVDEANARGAADAAAFAPLPPAQRATREQLSAAASLWLAALEHNDGHADPGGWPVSDDCVYFENGARISGNSRVRIGDNVFNLAALGCRQQLQSGWFALNTRVHHRRIVAVDPERGLVFAWANIDRAGIKALDLIGGHILALPSLQQPSGHAGAFVLRIENGAVKRVVSLSAPVPYGMGPGWDN